MAFILLAMALASACVIRPHVVTLQLANRPEPARDGSVRPTHTLRLTDYGMILWDTEPVNQMELVANLRAGLRQPREPDILFVPDANASYELSAQVLAVVNGTGVTRLALPNICAFRVFGKTPKPLPLTIHFPVPKGGIRSEDGKLPMTPDCTWQGDPMPVRDWRGL